jgi:hypothetical protein
MPSVHLLSKGFKEEPDVGLSGLWPCSDQENSDDVPSRGFHLVDPLRSRRRTLLTDSDLRQVGMGDVVVQHARREFEQ